MEMLSRVSTYFACLTLGFRCFALRSKSPRQSAAETLRNGFTSRWLSFQLGLIFAVDLMQQIASSLVFCDAQVDPDTEVRNDRRFPEGPSYSLVYLDGFDHIRILAAEFKNATGAAKQHSVAFARFMAACERRGVPLNEAKALIAEVDAPSLGGIFYGEKGWLALQGQKAQQLLLKELILGGSQRWGEAALRHWCGNAAFACQFRRPLFAILQQVCWEAEDLSLGVRAPSLSAFGEVLLFSMLLPLTFTNLRAPVRGIISATDASEDGGAASEATRFLPVLEASAANALEAKWGNLAEASGVSDIPRWGCITCNTLQADALGGRAACPGCGLLACSLPCLFAHRRKCLKESGGAHGARFGELSHDPKGCLTWDVAAKGADCVEPFLLAKGIKLYLLRVHLKRAGSALSTCLLVWQVPEAAGASPARDVGHLALNHSWSTHQSGTCFVILASLERELWKSRLAKLFKASLESSSLGWTVLSLV